MTSLTKANQNTGEKETVVRKKEKSIGKLCNIIIYQRRLENVIPDERKQEATEISAHRMKLSIP